MPCNLTATRQVLVMTDQAGETYELYFRMPTNDERVWHSNRLLERKGKKTVIRQNIFAEQVALGRKLIIGFSEGYFMDGDLFISSDPSKPYYRKDWRELLEQARPTDLQGVALAALRPALAGGGDDAEEEPVEMAEPSEDSEVAAPTDPAEAAEQVPLASSSEPS